MTYSAIYIGPVQYLQGEHALIQHTPGWPESVSAQFSDIETLPLNLTHEWTYFQLSEFYVREESMWHNPQNMR